MGRAAPSRTLSLVARKRTRSQSPLEARLLRTRHGNARGVVDLSDDELAEPMVEPHRRVPVDVLPRRVLEKAAEVDMKLLEEQLHC